MTEKTVIGSLPNSRPHRRSDKRGAMPAVGTPPENHRQAADADARTDEQRDPETLADPQSSGEPLTAAIQAAAELATLGISLSAKALRATVARLPRP